MLKGKHIIVGITGSIAAYKAALLVRLLVKAGAEVQVLMTEYAKAFITPLTLATLSKRPVLSQFQDNDTGEWNSHVALGQWADLFLVAPASANTLAKMANGIADNLLLTTYLSAKCPVIVAPAMDLDMYKHPANVRNVETLRSDGHTVLEADSGELASGLAGKGRLPEPAHILEYVEDFLNQGLPLSEKKILVTAGPTYEKIDPVRFIGNFSTGKMGFAIAEELANRGAQVTLIAGPVYGKTQNRNIQRIDVIGAQEMYQAARQHFINMDGAIMTAAVADFSPEKAADQKLKRVGNDLSLRLKPTVDIAATLGSLKKEGQLLAGFALETQNELDNARAKLERKNMDFIVLNSLNDPGAGFGTDTNKITIIDKLGAKIHFETKPKPEAAVDVVDRVQEFFDN